MGEMKIKTISLPYSLTSEVLAVQNMRLKLGVFKMSKHNTPAVGNTLDKFGLSYIPEAHNYLKVDGEIVDCTKPDSSKEDFIDDLISEMEIEPDQITEFKVSHHQTFLKNWLKDQPSFSLSFDHLWSIREQCIQDLSG